MLSAVVMRPSAPSPVPASNAAGRSSAALAPHVWHAYHVAGEQLATGIIAPLGDDIADPHEVLGDL
jgi:hypothetical protein